MKKNNINDEVNNNEDKDWWLPSKLTKIEELSRKIDDVNELDTRTDFGSYRKILLTNNINSTQIETHNDLSPASKIYLISKMVNIKAPLFILDAGCGMGFTTEAIAAQYPNAHVFGVDLSQDAIAYAQKNNTKVIYKSITIDPNKNKLGKFDLIYCFEFYPFTRNDNIEVQCSFINFFSKQLNNGGEIIIYQKWNNQISLSKIIEQIKNKCFNLNFKTIKIPHPKVYKYIPIISFSINICYFFEKIIKKELVKTLVIISKKNNPVN